MLWSNALVRPKQWRLEQLPVGSALRGWTMTQALTAAGGMGRFTVQQPDTSAFNQQFLSNKQQYIRASEAAVYATLLL